MLETVHLAYYNELWNKYLSFNFMRQILIFIEIINSLLKVLKGLIFYHKGKI